MAIPVEEGAIVEAEPPEVGTVEVVVAMAAVEAEGIARDWSLGAPGESKSDNFLKLRATPEFAPTVLDL